MIHTAQPSFNRHPELVSGSIEVPVRWPLDNANRAVGSFHAPKGPTAKWTLKQVQGDEFGSIGVVVGGGR